MTALALLIAIAGAGCGDDSDSDVPQDAVARVGDTLITKQEARKFVPETAERARLQQQAGRFLIVAEWLRREAKREGISVPTAPTTANGGSGRAAAVLGESTALTDALTKKAGGGAPPEEEIARYYREHPREYARPEVRYMRSVAAGSEAQANAAKRALEQGQSWKAVIARYSTRKGSPSPPSGDMGVQPGEFGEVLSPAVYAAERGTFNGPVKTDEAWYVFELTVIDRLPPQGLAAAREAISGRLQAIRQQRALQVVHRRLRDRYRPMTVCNEDQLLAVCSNGPPLDGASPLAFGL